MFVLKGKYHRKIKYTLKLFSTYLFYHF
jgi:hypothetical protein